ncbi:biotin-requiring enzyme family protein [Mycobacterium xenopi 4042]|uniref:Biotin-requiring enzyme family protein n=1 Tax=Mycobacterium xenopi 4042 TaxID=1299334 RepID=X8ANC3_MYCXE|nr:biotin-requiring enzyme family protein [Mycobacterium xenopi 4042]
MTVKPFVVPDLGEGLEEVTLSSWNVAVGDDVALNQPLCTVETAKAEVEIPSPYAGRIVEIHGTEGEVLPVGSLLVRIDTAPDTAETPSNGESGTRRPVLVGYGPMTPSTPAGGQRPRDVRKPNPRCGNWPPNCWSI